MFDCQSLMDSYWDGKVPVRTDHMANKLGFDVRPIKESSSEIYLILKVENGKRVIEYNKDLPTSLIRVCLAFAIVRIIENFLDNETRIYNKEILNINCIYSQSILLKSFNIIFPKEALDTYIHHMKVYEISRLAKIFDGWDYHMYYQMNKLKYF